MARYHPSPKTIEQHTCEEAGPLGIGAADSAFRSISENPLHAMPQIGFYERRMLARIRGPFVDNFAKVDPVLQQVVERASPKRNAALVWAAGSILDFRYDAVVSKFCH